MTTSENSPLVFRYKLEFSNGETKKFSISLDRTTLDIIQPAPPRLPEWTKLSHKKCPNCPLNESEHPRCPAAVSLFELIETFHDAVSHVSVDVTIETESRSYFKNTSLQATLSSLIGIHMVTSGCPVMEKLKPMVRYHLPFASTDETRYRVLSMYLLAQYLRKRRKKSADWSLRNLAKLYREIDAVDRAFCERLRAAIKGDASVNALVTLDSFAESINYLIRDDRLLKELNTLFSAHLK